MKELSKEEIEQEVEGEFKIDSDGFKLVKHCTETLGSHIAKAVPSSLDTKLLRRALVESRLSLRAREQSLEAMTKDRDQFRRGQDELARQLTDANKKLANFELFQSNVARDTVAIFKALNNPDDTRDMVEQVQEVIAQRDEYAKAIRENWTTGEGAGWYECRFCHAGNTWCENGLGYHHKSDCIVLKLGKEDK